MKRPVPNQTESPFNFHEFFFSTTDSRGVIVSGNEVFVRVSAYPREQMVGSPHSLIRHPDMPRAVFKVFWNFLNEGKPIGAYVKNLAGNGSYYWVFAFVFPIENGYLSIRFKPSSELFSAAQNIYSEVLEFEKNEGSLEDSTELLLSKVRAAGFADYDSFMVQAAIAELNARTENVKENNQRRQELSQNVHPRVHEISSVTAEATNTLESTFKKVQGFKESNQIFNSVIDALSDGFLNLKFISMNMAIAAAKLGEAGAGLGVVSKEFTNISSEIEKNLSGLENFTAVLTKASENCMLHLAALNLQMLMVDFFVKESIAKMGRSANAFSEVTENRPHFESLFKEYSKKLENEVSGLGKNLMALYSQMNDVFKFVTGLEVIRQIGAVESARTDEIKSIFSHYLTSMDDFNQILRSSTQKIRNEVETMGKDSKTILSGSHTLGHSVERIFQLAAEVEQNN